MTQNKRNKSEEFFRLIQVEDDIRKGKVSEENLTYVIKKANEHNDGFSQFLYALALLEGKVISENRVLALYYLDLASEHVNDIVLMEIASIYFHLSENYYEKGFICLKKGAKLGNLQAKKILKQSKKIALSHMMNEIFRR